MAWSGVALVRDGSDPLACARPVVWAAGVLEQACRQRGLPVTQRATVGEVPGDHLCVLVAGPATAAAVLAGAGVRLPEAAEAFVLARVPVGPRGPLMAAGRDQRGLVYALLELADRVALAPEPWSALAGLATTVECPANPIRSVARLFTSDVEDKAWFYDRTFWRRYLTLLASQRFNRFSLTLGLGYNFPRQVRDAYFYFAYPFLIEVPGYPVRVRGLPPEEREANLATLRFIGQEAAARGLHFQLALWTHAYECVDSPDVNYVVEGLTPETHAAYCRDALRLLLEACPEVGGVTLRVHGESGIPEGSYDFWRTVLSGVAACGRTVEIDLHSKGLDLDLIDVALATGMPVNVSPKYWAEHMGLPYHQASIRELERPRREAGREAGGAAGFMALSAGSRRFTRYGYADFLREDRRYGVLFRIWPGTQRLLLWGDPAMAAGYGRYAGFCGALGVELCEPLSFKGRMGSGLPGGRDGYADPSLRPPGGDWEKYLYTYRLWGRLLYDPGADPEAWRRHLRHELGEGARAYEAALGQASRILPLVTTAYHPSASNNVYWPELYTNLPIVPAVAEARPPLYRDTPDPKRFTAASSCDPELFSSIDEFVDEALAGRPSGRYSPLEVADWLASLAEGAEAELARAEAATGGGPATPAARRWAVDVRAQSGLGRFFAWKLRAGTAYALYRRTGDREALREAVEAYRQARRAWAEVAAVTRAVYRDDLTFGLAPHLRGHWADRLPAIDEDLAAMERELAALAAGAPEGSPSREARREAGPGGGQEVAAGAAGGIVPASRLEALARRAARPALCLRHEPPPGFQRGQGVVIEVAVAPPGAARVHLRYRRVNQAEAYGTVPMAREGHRFRAVIPAAYTDSPYPLLYFFQVEDAAGRVGLYPGLGPDLCHQPYFVLRPKGG